MTDKAIDAAARAIFALRYPDTRDYVFGEYLPGTAMSRHEAQAAISAYLTQREAEGWVMCPVVATETMEEAATALSCTSDNYTPDLTWELMIAARPQVNP